ncbi:hypothetical protein FHR99_001514 [Litorivivens lipolytica]|uniref:SMP-30/Gluconolactonase/LRE-like region domain-containing protein n=1 Tax=Litorivivens lipolytica TaxID=1524264 RepID=A0A7W4W529_9GAMM|nr:SMP-30/gluconolactonase/LRE family protein [Litorivivens lipolytica]MBB3047278.1 hypothetical protein [Litorivivens lipolytica]
MKRFSLLLLPFLLAACDAQQDFPCEPVDDRVPICGLQAPEDIEPTPDGKQLILSQFGGITGSSAGSLVLFDPQTEKTLPLYPLANQTAQPEGWGSEDCPGAPGAAISPHGIHLSERSDGRWQLLVVNHGGRESVEFFEWRSDNTLQWQGCVVPPGDAFLNDVVATPDGGFLVTHMFPKDNVLAIVRTLFGAELGHVWQWHPDTGMSILPGSAGSFPNGIQISADGQHVFLNHYINNRVRKLKRETGEVLGDVSVAQPDNSSWLPDGRLIVASHPQDKLLPGLCGDVHNGACESRFELVAIDPATLEAEMVFSQQGAPMGAGTVAVEWGPYWFIGSYAGNRLLRVPAPQSSDAAQPDKQ